MNQFYHAIALTISVLACISCNNSKFDTGEGPSSNDPYASNERQWVEINGCLAEEVPTKTVRKEDGKIYWKPADDINVFFGSDKGHFTSTNTEDVLTAQFTGTLLISSVVGMNEGAEDDNCLWGMYPYDENATLSNGEITTSLCEDQIGVAGSFKDDSFITLAKNSSFSLAFYNVLSGFRFTVTRSGINSMSFRGNDSEVLAGQLKLSFGDNSRPVVNSITNGKTELTLIPENGEFEIGEDYYILMVPTLFSNGFTVTMTTTDNKSGVFVYSNSISFARNIFVRKRNVDSGVQFNSIQPDPGTNEKVGYDVVNI